MLGVILRLLGTICSFLSSWMKLKLTPCGFSLSSVGSYLTQKVKKTDIKSVHFKKPVTRSSFLSKSVVIFAVVILKMTTLFERNEDRLYWLLKMNGL